MADSGDGDKFGSLITPNCLHTASLDEKLQSCPFASGSKVFLNDTNSSSSSEKDTGIEIITLPESSDEYHTPPEDHSFSENSSNDAHLPTKTSTFDRNMEDQMPVDNLGFPEKCDQVVVDNNTRTVDSNDTDPIDAAKSVSEVVEDKNAHQVFVEMPQGEQETSNREKRKLPFSMNTRKQNSNFFKHETFVSSLNRVLKMVEEGKRNGGGDGNDDDDVDIDFMETAKMRGLKLPRPRWWPAQGFKD